MEEKLLWETFLGGDKFAFNRIVQHFYKESFQYGMKFTDDADLVKDCLQEMFLTLWTRRSHLNPVDSIKGYLFVSLRRLLHKKVLGQKKHLTQSLDADADFGIRFSFSFDEHYVQNESYTQMAAWLNNKLIELPSRQKEVLYLRFFKQLTRNETSEVMGISPQTVANLQLTAIKTLKERAQSENKSFDLLLWLSAIQLSTSLVN